MVDAQDARYGPHSARVEALLKWIDSGELLRFGKPLSGPFIPVADFEEARRLARRAAGRLDWTEFRENAETDLHIGRVLDTPPWSLHKAGIEGLVDLIGDAVAAALPEGYPGILDDVIADLHACARCLAVHGRLDPFHDRLWAAYACGGWPCGCTGEEPEPPDELELEGREFYVFWREAK